MRRDRDLDQELAGWKHCNTAGWRRCVTVRRRLVTQPVRLPLRSASGLLAFVYSIPRSPQYVADDTDGMQVIDVSNPANPQRVGGTDTGVSVTNVALSGNYALVAGQAVGGLCANGLISRSQRNERRPVTGALFSCSKAVKHQSYENDSTTQSPPTQR